MLDELPQYYVSKDSDIKIDLEEFIQHDLTDVIALFDKDVRLTSTHVERIMKSAFEAKGIGVTAFRDFCNSLTFMLKHAVGKTGFTLDVGYDNNTPVLAILLRSHLASEHQVSSIALTAYLNEGGVDTVFDLLTVLHKDVVYSSKHVA